MTTGVRVPQSPMRRAIGRAMTASKKSAPHFYITSETDVTDLLADLRSWRTERGIEVSFTAALAMATARALVQHSRLNAHWIDDELVTSDEVSLGLAIALDDGLVAPALVDCASWDLATFSQRIENLARRARRGRLRRVEMTGQTFTVSNLGMYDVSSFVAIIPPPQVAILAAGSAAERPGVIGGRVEVRRMVQLTVSADHRAVDGTHVAEFLRSLDRELGRLVSP